MFRLADRIVVLRHGRLVAEVAPSEVHPDDVVALVSGQEVDSSARRQLTRLHGLTDRLVSADPSSSLSLILSALGAALGSERLCIHLLADAALVCAASLGLPPPLLPPGPGCRWARRAARSGWPRPPQARSSRRTCRPARPGRRSPSWPGRRRSPAPGRCRCWARAGCSASSPCSAPPPGKPQRDDLDLVTLYAGYAASAIERDRLLDEVTARNRVLETIREMLETLAGPIPVADGLGSPCSRSAAGLQADEVALIARRAGRPAQLPGLRRPCADPAGPDATDDRPGRVPGRAARPRRRP